MLFRIFNLFILDQTINMVLLKILVRYESVDNKMLTICIYLDIAEAFDIVDHTMMIQKLKIIGF